MEYRTTALKRGELDGVVLAATFALHGGERGKLLAEIARDAELRRSKHPLEYASCGSYFKNPSRETPAAALIERAGLKGFALGGASVSVKHANFLVAAPGCRADEIRALAVEVKRRVFETTGVRLQEEVVHLGFAPRLPAAPAFDAPRRHWAVSSAASCRAAPGYTQHVLPGPEPRTPRRVAASLIDAEVMA